MILKLYGSISQVINIKEHSLLKFDDVIYFYKAVGFNFIILNEIEFHLVLIEDDVTLMIKYIYDI